MLRITENYFSTTGSRLFNVNVEGGPNIFTPDLDLVSVTGGQNIAFKLEPSIPASAADNVANGVARPTTGT